MGTMQFQLPPNLPADVLAGLEHGSVAGGQDCMPYPSQAILEDGQLLLHRRVDESGSLHVPWNVAGAGHLMCSTATLMERLAPYQLPLELARGKVNHVRGQLADWLMGGLLLTDPVGASIKEASHLFGKAASQNPGGDSWQYAERAQASGFEAAHQLVQSYMQQVFQVRHQRQPRLDTWLVCGLQERPAADASELLSRTFNGVQLAFPWRALEPSEGNHQWDMADELTNWALQQGFHVIGGPLIDFSGRDLPDWLWEKERDLLSLSNYLTGYLSQVVRRYHTRIRTWQVSAASNWAGVLAMGDEELLWLTVRIIEALKKIDPGLEIIVGIAQPWGDYLAQQERTQSPFAFADTLLRTGVKLAALELEMFMGLSPRGSYCRDTLDASRILDLYALLGTPLQVALAYPAASDADPRADADERTHAGHWRGGFSPAVQADWASHFAGLAVCKPYVRAARWMHFSDAVPHAYPHCGLVDAAGQPKPALAVIQQLRAEHLK